MNRTERIQEWLEHVPYVETGQVRGLEDLFDYKVSDEWVQWTIIDDSSAWGSQYDGRIAVLVKIVEEFRERVVYYAQRYIDDYDKWEMGWKENQWDCEYREVDAQEEFELWHLIEYGCNRYFVADIDSNFLPHDQFYLDMK